MRHNAAARQTCIKTDRQTDRWAETGRQAYLLVATGVEHDLSNHGIVWDHHGHSTEQSLEVVWQLRAAGIAGIHGDEDIAAGPQRKLAAFKDEALHLGLHRHLDFQHLLCHH